MNRVWATRIAAPAAFLAGVTLALVLVRAGLEDEPPAATVVATRTARTTAPTTTAPARRRFAVVREGDTLEAIAERHETTVERLLALNPGLDTTNLQIGQRVRVR